MSARGLAALIALAACYDARPFPGAPCASNGACPSGLVCAPNGKCESTGGFDAPIDTPADSAIDAPADAAIDAWDNGSCTARSSYSPGDFGSNQAAYPASGMYPEEWDGFLTDAAMPDLLDIQLYPNSGVFSGENVGTGTFTIGSSPQDTTYTDCGLCGMVETEVNTLTYVETDDYYWESGTVTLASVSGTLSGSLQNLVFRQVDFSGSNWSGTESDDPSGCMTRIGSATFSATIDTADSFTGTTSLGTQIHIGLRSR